jgi:2',3'-cyclic-nucleotide 2'-phosphodiesterase (5'-nucleotidase family)
MTNGGSIKANIKSGEITVGDVYNVLPYGSSLAVKLVTPKKLYEVLEHSISELKLNKDSTRIQNLSSLYPQISGMRFEMDLNKTKERVINVYLKDKENSEILLDKFDDKTKIALVSNDFLISGGDGFDMLASGENIAEGNALDEIFASYITNLTDTAGGSFTYEMDGNRSVEINICNK